MGVWEYLSQMRDGIMVFTAKDHNGYLIVLEER
jgi:hypothetical protein